MRARIAQPQSKRATGREWYDHGAMAIHLDRVYRSMDGLDDRAVETICQRSLDVDHDRRLIVTHSPRRARKDAYDRTRQIAKLRVRLARFLDFPDGTVQRNADKVAAASC